LQELTMGHLCEVVKSHRLEVNQQTERVCTTNKCSCMFICPVESIL